MPEADTALAAANALAAHGIGWAVKQMWDGHVVRRRGWNGKGMYIALTLPSISGGLDMTAPFVFMKTATNDRVPWLCSQTDLLAIDWEIAEEIPA